MNHYLFLQRKQTLDVQKQSKTKVKVFSCLLFRVLLVLLELLVSPDQEEDPDPRVLREPLDREVSL